MEQQILDILEERYNLTGSLKELVAYQDKNFILTDRGGEKFVIKITTDPKELDFVHTQGLVFQQLSNQKICKPVLTSDSKGWVDIPHENKTLPLRVFPFIDGPFLSEVKPDTSFYQKFGSMLGQMDSEMKEIDDPVLVVQSHVWDLARFQELRSLSIHIKDPEIRRLVEYFFMMHKEKISLCYPKLPKGLIHSDPNDWNVILKEISPDKWDVKGLIDFGDMVYTARINELAIALAYSSMRKENPLEIAEAMVRGYHQEYSLIQTELSCLYYLIPARLCTTIVMAAKKGVEDPDNEYHQISAEPAINLLKKWIRINPFLFENQMMLACGFEGLLNQNDISDTVSQKIVKRHKHMSKSQSVSYQKPIEMLGSALQYMYAADGRTYLDCVNNIPHVGHCHPRVVEAGQKQMAILNTNTRYVYDILNVYSEKVLATFPGSLSKVFFVNSGSAATDLAVRLAKTHTGRKEFKVLDHAYHGNISTAIGLSPYKFNRKGGDGKPLETHIAGLKAYGFRIKDKVKEMKEAKEKYKTEMQESPESLESQVPESQSPRVPESPSPKVPESQSPRVSESQTPRVPELAAFVAESIPGCAGQVMLDKDFMQHEVEEIRNTGGLYIADEVQTGFARVGKHFWGFELYDLVPDIVVLGKPIANGHPMGAVVCTDAVAESFETGMEFFSSFGGNPVSCEVANAVLDVIKDEKLQENAESVGSYLLTELREIQQRAQSTELRAQSAECIDQTLSSNSDMNHPSSQRRVGTHRTGTIIKEVRGTGLFIGIELVKSIETNEPDPESASRIVNRLKENGFLLSTDGPYENVIKFKPPMIFSKENAKELVAEIKKSL